MQNIIMTKFYIYNIYILILTYINILPHVQIEKKDYLKAYIKLPQSLLKLSCWQAHHM